MEIYKHQRPHLRSFTSGFKINRTAALFLGHNLEARHDQTCGKTDQRQGKSANPLLKLVVHRQVANEFSTYL